VEEEAASSDDQVTDEGDEEDAVVSILSAVVDTAEGRRVDGGIVVLGLVRLEDRVFKELYDEPPRTS
jgi:hypothetical protein